MTNFMVPTDTAFIEDVAKSIAKSRLHRDAAYSMNVDSETYEQFESLFDRMFEELWAGSEEIDEYQRSGFRQDALSAINAINLKLITTLD